MSDDSSPPWSPDEAALGEAVDRLSAAVLSADAILTYADSQALSIYLNYLHGSLDSDRDEAVLAVRRIIGLVRVLGRNKVKGLKPVEKAAKEVESALVRPQAIHQDRATGTISSPIPSSPIVQLGREPRVFDHLARIRADNDLWSVMHQVMNSESAVPSKRPTGKTAKGQIEAREHQTVDGLVYLGDGSHWKSVESALAELLAAAGIEIEDKGEPQFGSFWRRFTASAKEKLTTSEMQDRLVLLEQAAKIQTLGKPQAEVDSATADAASKLIESLKDEPNAVIQVGSLLLVKANGVVICKQLTQLELAFLDKHPDLCLTPQAMLVAMRESRETVMSQLPTAGRMGELPVADS